MAKLDCPCGHTFSDVADPNPSLSYRVTAEQLDTVAFLGSSDYLPPEIWQCPCCHRLAVAKDERSMEFNFYQLEEEKLECLGST